MKYLFVFLLVGLMVSCGDASGDASENVKPKLKEYSYDEVTKPNDILLLKKNMKPVTGIVKGNYEDGKLEYEGNYKDGKYDGLHRYWYEDGQLRSEGNWKDDKLDGLWRSWHENGQLESEDNYKDGMIDGYQSEDGVDTGASSNYIYDSTDKYYKVNVHQGVDQMW